MGYSRNKSYTSDSHELIKTIPLVAENCYNTVEYNFCCCNCKTYGRGTEELDNLWQVGLVVSRISKILVGKRYWGRENTRV